MPSRLRSSEKWKLFGGLAFAAFLLTVLLMLGLVKLHEELGRAGFVRVDEAIQSRVHGLDSPGVTRGMRTLSFVGSPLALFPAVSLAAAVLWWKRRRDAAVVLAIATLGGAALDQVLKLHFRRTRPDVPWAFVHEHSFSFPSGHSVLAVVLYGVIVYKTQDKLRTKGAKAALMVAAFAMVIGIGVSRIYLGVHYPSDVAGGYFVGGAWLAAVIWADLWVKRVEAAERGEA